MDGSADASRTATPRRRLTRTAAARSIPAAWLVGALFLYLGTDQLWLLRFLGVATAGGVLLRLALLLALCVGATRSIVGGIPPRRLAVCLLIAFCVLLLGGEGHVFYANDDWQVRDAVLADMIRWPWPFAYAGLGAPQMLRAPLGMYLLPALLGKALGMKAASYALLVRNTLLLGVLLALGSLLFATPRARRIALAVVVAFSGMDTIALLLVRPDLLLPLDGHIEAWAPQLQYSSAITLAFWVPQHAVSGWIGGLFFLLWRRGLVPLGALLSVVPLCLLWSPLGAIGTLPFALLAGVQAIASRRVRWPDILLPAASVLLAVPSLAYLGADAGKVGFGIVPIPPIRYILFEAVEVVPVLALAAALGGAQAYGKATLLTVALCLALLPFVMLGKNDDFVMRASIPSLLILSVIAAKQIAETARSALRTRLIIVLSIGALTPAREVYRAILYRATPFPACDLAASGTAGFSRFGRNTYFAATAAMPAFLRAPIAATAPPTTAPCYARPWMVRRLALSREPASARAGLTGGRAGIPNPPRGRSGWLGIL
jgi:hypothetical protein